MARRIGIAFLVLGLLGVLALWVYLDVLSPARRSNRVDAAPARPLPERERAAAQTLERLKVQAQAPAPPPSSPGSPAAAPSAPQARDPNQFGLTITEREANELIQSLPDIRNELLKAKVEDLEVRFEPDRLVAEARVPAVAGMKARVTAAGRLFAQNGRLGYETESVRIGSFPAPDAVRDELDKQLTASVEQLNKKLRGQIQEVVIGNRELRVRGMR
ncbi:MAG: hypothetical protein K0Q72_1081 [Armatimonadetes bacterium]|nr:hypothetical protein [Armatimonadota bacterium]